MRPPKIDFRFLFYTPKKKKKNMYLKREKVPFLGMDICQNNTLISTTLC